MAKWDWIWSRADASAQRISDELAQEDFELLRKATPTRILFESSRLIIIDDFGEPAVYIHRSLVKEDP